MQILEKNTVLTKTKNENEKSLKIPTKLDFVFLQNWANFFPVIFIKVEAIMTPNECRSIFKMIILDISAVIVFTRRLEPR